MQGWPECVEGLELEVQLVNETSCAGACGDGTRDSHRPPWPGHKAVPGVLSVQESMLRALALLLVLRSAGAWAVLAVSRLPFRADKKYLRLGGSPESRVSRYLYLADSRRHMSRAPMHPVQTSSLSTVLRPPRPAPLSPLPLPAALTIMGAPPLPMAYCSCERNSSTLLARR